MRELETFELARILIRTATGEEYGDGYVVTDLVRGYAESRNGDDDSVIVFGNWNDRQPYEARKAGLPATKAESLPVRLGNLLEQIGANAEWSDEWSSCIECNRAVRTQADSYCWTMYGAWSEYGVTCQACMLKDPEAYLPEYVNDPEKAIVWMSRSELESIGFEQWEPSEPHTYASGWYPGQTDDPKQIMREITEELDDSESGAPDATTVFSSEREIVFLISDVGQFDIHFQAFVRTRTNDPEV